MRGAIVLAGGDSRRMGGPKALVPFTAARVPLAAWMMGILLPVTDERVVVARGPLARRLSRMFAPTEATVVADRLKVHAPLSGMQAGAEALRSGYVAVVPCDVPLLQPQVMEALFHRARGRTAAIPRWPDGRIEPLVAVYRRDALLAASRASVKARDWSAHGIVERLRNPRFVDVESLRRSDPSLRSFVNVNTPRELAAAEKQFRGEDRVTPRLRPSPRSAPRPRRR